MPASELEANAEQIGIGVVPICFALRNGIRRSRDSRKQKIKEGRRQLLFTGTRILSIA